MNYLQSGLGALSHSSRYRHLVVPAHRTESGTPVVAVGLASWGRAIVQNPAVCLDILGYQAMATCPSVHRQSIKAPGQASLFPVLGPSIEGHQVIAVGHGTPHHSGESRLLAIHVRFWWRVYVSRASYCSSGVGGFGLQKWGQSFWSTGSGAKPGCDGRCLCPGIPRWGGGVVIWGHWVRHAELQRLVCTLRNQVLWGNWEHWVVVVWPNTLCCCG